MEFQHPPILISHYLTYTTGGWAGAQIQQGGHPPHLHLLLLLPQLGLLWSSPTPFSPVFNCFSVWLFLCRFLPSYQEGLILLRGDY